MISVNVLSEERAWSRKLRKKEIFFNKICSFFPKKYQFSNKKVNLTLLLSNNKGTKKLNKDFRNKNKSTDVLSFPFEKKFNSKKSSYLGDIVISYEFMNKPINISILKFKQKVVKIFIHGFLHLLGHDHIKLKDFKKMSKEEDNIFKFIKTKVA